ncbi:MAG: 3-isopropylmalate dehydratase large subunit [Candidatus Omnitrophota bacterium]
MGQTIAEKILSMHAGKKVYAGDIAICDVDFCFGQDGTSSLIIDSLKKIGARKIFNPDKFSMVIDHSAPSPNMGVSRVHKKMRDFAAEQGVKIYDIGCGVCHVVIPEDGLVVPGDLVAGADSHTCTYGALNAFSCGFGSTDLAVVAACGRNWFKVPQSVKIIISGRRPKGVYSKDIILHIIGALGADGGTYKSIEFIGEAIDNLSMDARFTISNMVVEAGAKCGIMPADHKTLDWVKTHSKRTPRVIAADDQAKYTEIRQVTISKMSPQVAKPHSVDNVVPIEEVLNTHIDQAYLGTCTNGRIEDLEIAAMVLKHKRIHPRVRFIVAPASRQIYLEAIKRGIMGILIEAGAAVVTPGCGPCVGTHNGVPAENEVVISSANRNFKGRMGQSSAAIYLASPATVCASAIEGKIADPRGCL